jgi:hypothetical protein
MKHLLWSLLILCIASCNDGSGGDIDGRSDSMSGDTMQSTPSAIDTMQHPNGMTGGGVISRDTAAMSPDSANGR